MSQPYHHGNLRSVMIEQAVDLARETGPAGVVLREVARRAGVSHNAAYRHFADREELLGEVTGVAMGRLEQAMRDRLERVTTTEPAERARLRLREIGRAYVEFALAEEGLFSVAFAVAESPVKDAEEREAGPYTLLNEVLDELVDAGAVPAVRRPAADIACWAAVHGFSELNVHGPLRELTPELREHALEAMLDVIESGLLTTSQVSTT